MENCQLRRCRRTQAYMLWLVNPIILHFLYSCLRLLPTQCILHYLHVVLPPPIAMHINMHIQTLTFHGLSFPNIAFIMYKGLRMQLQKDITHIPHQHQQEFFGHFSYSKVEITHKQDCFESSWCGWSWRKTISCDIYFMCLIYVAAFFTKMGKNFLTPFSTLTLNPVCTLDLNHLFGQSASLKQGGYQSYSQFISGISIDCSLNSYQFFFKLLWFFNCCLSPAYLYPIFILSLVISISYFFGDEIFQEIGNVNERLRVGEVSL